MFIASICLVLVILVLQLKWKWKLSRTHNNVIYLNKLIRSRHCVMNLVAIPQHGLLHHTTAAHHSTSDYNSHHSLHLRRTHSQLIALIIHCTDHTAAPHHPLYISFGLQLLHCEVLFSPVWHFRAFPWVCFPVFTWTAYTTLTVCCLPFDPACLSISSLSAACPGLCIAPVADSALPSLHLLLSLNLACLFSSYINKAAFGSQRPVPSHYTLM